MIRRMLFERAPTFPRPPLVALALVSSPGVGQPIVCTPRGTTVLEREQDPLENREDAPPADKIDRRATPKAVLALVLPLRRRKTGYALMCSPDFMAQRPRNVGQIDG